jgi:hypothetical protein
MLDQAYYIVVTAIFGVFVFFIMWWLYVGLYKSEPKLKSKRDLNSRDKEVLALFCSNSKD